MIALFVLLFLIWMLVLGAGFVALLRYLGLPYGICFVLALPIAFSISLGSVSLLYHFLPILLQKPPLPKPPWTSGETEGDGL